LYLATDEGIERAQAIHIENATSQAKKAGNLDPNGAGSPTHPEITRALYGDGKTIKALYDPPKERTNKGEKKSDESPVRVDEDAAWYEEGGDDKSGGYRWYNDYRLPQRMGGGIVTVRLHTNDDDITRRFNRTENVRPILRAILTSRTSTRAGTTPSPSTGASKTPCSSGEPIASGAFANKPISSATRCS
jgi:hypothetical protein